MSQLLKIFFYEILIHVSYNYKCFFILIDDVTIGFFYVSFILTPKGDEFKGKYFVKPIRKRIHEELRELKERKKAVNQNVKRKC